MLREPKKCPFCGGEPELRYKGITKWRYSDTVCIVFVRCTFCKAQSQVFPDDSFPDENGSDWEDNACINAVAAWNKRVCLKGEDNGE